MCGILGCLPSPDEGTFKGALSNLTHRGPDGTGVWNDEGRNITLGHTRLSIIDLSDSAAQPMHYGRYVIVFNGEIYNYKELKAELEQKGHCFSTCSDTEVLVSAYAEWGVDCLQRLNGMWAFAIWDKEKRLLFFSRDRFGLKPFLYTRQGGKFVFASEMKALTPLMDTVEVADEFAWMAIHMLDYEATENCLIKGIKRLLPGHYGVYDQGLVNITRYYHMLDGVKPDKSSYEDKVERFRELFDDAVQLRLRSDVPVGCALSGGLDSSAVFASIHGQYRKESFAATPKAFTAHFPGSAIDELRFAEGLAGQFNMPIERVEVDGTTALAQLPDDVYYFEELYRNAPSPMMQLYRRYRQQGVYVSLDGHGPDELFSGYGNFISLALLDAGMDTGEWDNILKTYNDMFPEEHGQFKTKKLDYSNILKARAWYAKDSVSGFRSENEKDLSATYKSRLKEMGYLNAGLYRLFNFTTFPTLLRNYDHYSMRSGVEIRMPFTDYRLVEFCFSLNWKDKLNGGYTKKLLRDALAPDLPEDIVWRKEKVGFQSPLADWFKGPWKEWLEDSLNSASFKQHSLTDARKANKLYASFTKDQNPDLEAANAVWQQLMPYLWQEHFFKRINAQR